MYRGQSKAELSRIIYTAGKSFSVESGPDPEIERVRVERPREITRIFSKGYFWVELFEGKVIRAWRVEGNLLGSRDVEVPLPGLKPGAHISATSRVR